MENIEVKKRESNFELLRILAMVMIVISHFAAHGGFDFPNTEISINRLWIQLCEIGGVIGDNLFVLISGYYLIDKKNLNLSRILKMWLQMFMYSFIIYGIFVVFGKTDFKLIMFVKVLCPVTFEMWWFPSTYILMYLFSPLLNKTLKHISRNIGISNVVFHYVPTSIVDCQWVTAHENETKGIITPIGYQPFMRCSAQYGYMMTTNEDYDLMKDKLFKKIKFRLTEGFCKWIYEEMDCGRAIYPNDEDIARIQDIVHIVSGMNSRTEFSRYNAENVRKDIAACISDKSDAVLDPIYFYSNLKRYGIRIKDKVELLSDKNIGRINKRYTLDKIESRMELPKCSPMFAIG